MLGEVNQALARAADKTSLLDDVCRSVVEFGLYPLAWIGFAAPGSGGPFQPAAQAGAWPTRSGQLAQLARAAAASGRTMAVRSIHTDPALAAWQEEAERQGFTAAIAVPFAVDGRGRGVLAIGSAEAEAFDDGETELLEELGRDVAYGLSTFTMRAALSRADELLRATSRLARVGGWEFDTDTQTMSWSEESYRIHEVDPDTPPDLAGAVNFYAPESRPVITAAFERAMADGTPYNLELPFITAKGNHLWVRTQAQAEMKDGRCVRLWGTFQDITARKQAESDLRDLVRSLSLVGDNAMENARAASGAVQSGT